MHARDWVISCLEVKGAWQKCPACICMKLWKALCIINQFLTRMPLFHARVEWSHAARRQSTLTSTWSSVCAPECFRNHLRFIKSIYWTEMVCSVHMWEMTVVWDCVESAWMQACFAQSCALRSAEGVTHGPMTPAHCLLTCLNRALIIRLFGHVCHACGSISIHAMLSCMRACALVP